MKIQTLLMMMFLMLSTKIIACDCEYEGSFLKVSNHNSFIAEIKVIKFLTFDSMEVEIVEIYKRQEKRKSVVVWGDSGKLCRPYLSQFKENQHYVISFSAAGQNGTEKISDYSISNCGTYWLSLDTQKTMISGYIEGQSRTMQTISIEEFKNKFKNSNGY